MNHNSIRIIRTAIVLSIIWLYLPCGGQMIDGVDTLYGDEWITESTQYHFAIEERGWYRIGYELLAPYLPSGFRGDHVHLHCLGRSVPLLLSRSHSWGPEDHLYFYHAGTDGSLDSYLYSDSETEMLNPKDNMFWDSTSYYLSYSEEESTLTYQRLESDSLWLSDTIRPQAVRDTIFDQGHSQKSVTIDNVPLALSRFESIEGFGTGFINVAQAPWLTEISALDASSIGNLKLHIRLGRSELYPALEVAWNGSPIDTLEEPGEQLLDRQWDIPLSKVNTSNALSIRGIQSGQNNCTIAFCEWSYPTGKIDPNIRALSWEVDSAAAGVLTVASPTAGFLVDHSNLECFELDSQYTNPTSHAVLPPQDRRELTLLDLQNTATISSLKPVSLSPYERVNGSYVMIVGEAFVNSEAVSDYAAYRSSSYGGSHEVQVMAITDLYHLYSYGQKHHPLALRNAIHAWEDRGIMPGYVLLVGKGIAYDAMHRDPSLIARCHVPTYGTPGADNLLMSRKGQTTPLVPFGRLAIENQSQLQAYLNKVISYEKQMSEATDFEDRSWRKRVLHLTGGDEDASLIRPQMEILGKIIRDGGFGGELLAYDKELDQNPTAPLSPLIIDEVNRGVAIKTFFGHGAVTSTDFALDDPSLFDNKDLYPLMFSLGCLTGNLHTGVSSLSEDFIFAPERGGIGYIASSGYGFVSSLRRLASSFYSNLGGEMYTATIGELMRATLEAQENTTALSVQLLKEQLTYHGDPALHLNSSDKPDFQVKPLSVRITPEIPTLQDSVFVLSMQIVNLGRYTPDSLDVSCSYSLPGSHIPYLFERRIACSTFQTQLDIPVPILGSSALGQNKIEIQLDPTDQVSEGPLPIAENNNNYTSENGQQGHEFVIVDGSTDLLYPMDFGIENGEKVLFLAQADFHEGLEELYVFRCDTTPRMDSPLARIDSMYAEGGLLEWEFHDWLQGQEYYWSVTDHSTMSSGLSPVHSFVYDTLLSNGWNQSDYFQLLDNDFENLSLDEDRQFRIDSSMRFLQYSSVQSVGPFYLDKSLVFLDGERIARMVGFGNGSSSRSRVMVCVQDGITGKLWQNPPHGMYGSDNINDSTYTFYWHTHTAEKRKSLIRFLRDTIPDGHYVVVLSGIWGDNPLGVESWYQDDTSSVGTTLYDLWEMEGAQIIRSMEERGSVPFFLCYRKGSGLLAESIGLTSDTEVNGTLELSYPGTTGSMISPWIGPLDSIVFEKQNQNLTDFPVEILGASSPGSSETLSLVVNIPTARLDTTPLGEYSYFKLSWPVSESSPLIPLDYWRLSGKQMADLQIDPHICYHEVPVISSSGQALPLRIGIRNLGSMVSDSCTILFSATDQRGYQVQWTASLPPVAPGDSLCIEDIWLTQGLKGSTQLVMLVNPDRSVLENHYQNNLHIVHTFLQEDISAPLLSVHVDGRAVEDFSVVSGQPRVVIKLWDENKFAPLTSDNLELLIRDPQGNIVSPSDWEQYMVVMDSQGVSSVLMSFVLRLDQDGYYTLTANGVDSAGNRARVTDYLLRIRRESEVALSSMVCSPNPGDENMRFQYYYTGLEAPQSMEIRFYNAWGQPMGLATESQLGELIGGLAFAKTLKELVPECLGWPNGLYHYSVIARGSDGQVIPHNPSHPISRGWKQNKFVLQR